MTFYDVMWSILLFGVVFFAVYTLYLYTEAVTKISKDINIYARIDKRSRYIYIYSGKKELPIYVKIGRTRNSPLARLRAQRTANPHGLHVWAIIVVKDEVWAETYLHRMFKEDRVSSKNEWFKISWKLMVLAFALRNKNLTKKVQHLLNLG